jgi:hypothetical protein
MRRLFTLVVVLFALLALAPAVAADTTASQRPVRESFEATGFDAFSSECEGRTCTDTFVFAEEVTTSSGETFEYVCVEQVTYSTRTGRVTSQAFGCADTTNLTVASDLSSATLSPTDVEVCGSQGRSCETVTVSAELEATGGRGSFRARGSFQEGNCTFTFVDSGEQRSAGGTITLDGDTMEAQGSIRTFQSTFTQRCRA